MIQKCLLILVVLAVSVSCSRSGGKNSTDDFYKGERIVKLKNPTLKEISGMVSSQVNPGYFWVHNDSGDESRIFLIDSALKIIMTCTLDSAENRDWEDIAIGPGPVAGKTYLYVGDIGDNDQDFRYKYIYRLEEPKFNGMKTVSVQPDKITVELEGARKDTETLLFDPLTKDLFVVSKREEPVWIYKIPYPYEAGDTLTAAKLFSLPMTQVVGGDVSPDGNRVLLKNYEHVYYWYKDDKKHSLEKLLSNPPHEVPYEIEPQGEAITWANDLSGFYTLSEKNVGKETYLYYYKARHQLRD